MIGTRTYVFKLLKDCCWLVIRSVVIMDRVSETGFVEWMMIVRGWELCVHVAWSEEKTCYCSLQRTRVLFSFNDWKSGTLSSKLIIGNQLTCCIKTILWIQRILVSKCTYFIFAPSSLVYRLFTSPIILRFISESRIIRIFITTFAVMPCPGMNMNLLKTNSRK